MLYLLLDEELLLPELLGLLLDAEAINVIVDVISLEVACALLILQVHIHLLAPLGRQLSICKGGG